jgi:hypothetical protein
MDEAGGLAARPGRDVEGEGLEEKLDRGLQGEAEPDVNCLEIAKGGFDVAEGSGVGFLGAADEIAEIG